MSAAAAKSISTLLHEKLLAIPPVSRALLLIHVVLSFAHRLGYLSPRAIAMDWTAVAKRMQVYRLLTNPLFVPINGIFYIFTLIWIHSISVSVETNLQATSDYVYCTILLILASSFYGACFNNPFNSDPYLFALSFIYGQMFSGKTLSFMSFFKFDASLICYVYGLSSVLLFGSQPLPIVAGILIGNLYYVLKFSWPKKGGLSLLETPNIVAVACGERIEESSFVMRTLRKSKERRPLVAGNSKYC